LFTPIDRLPAVDMTERHKVRSRWNDNDGQIVFQRVLELLHQGPVRGYFLQRAFDSGELRILDHIRDLRGLTLNGQFRYLPRDTFFGGIDFSYGQFSYEHFEDASFNETYFAFGRLFTCSFRSCDFWSSAFYGTTFENCHFISCAFWLQAEFVNCDFKNVHFRECLFTSATFRDCRFDSRCHVNPPEAVADRYKSSLRRAVSTDFYLGLAEGFREGGVAPLADDCLFRSLKATRRYNCSWEEWPMLVVREVTTGYGLKPARVVGTMCVVLAIGTLWYGRHLEWREAVLLASGAMLTFGASTDRLQTLPVADVAAYLALAFAGVTLTALFVTAAARRIFTLR
jgi:hypothetical protein